MWSTSVRVRCGKRLRGYNGLWDFRGGGGGGGGGCSVLYVDVMPVTGTMKLVLTCRMQNSTSLNCP